MDFCAVGHERSACAATDHFDVDKAGGGQVLQQLAANAAGTDHEHLDGGGAEVGPRWGLSRSGGGWREQLPVCAPAPPTTTPTLHVRTRW